MFLSLSPSLSLSLKAMKKCLQVSIKNITILNENNVLEYALTVLKLVVFRFCDEMIRRYVSNSSLS